MCSFQEQVVPSLSFIHVHILFVLLEMFSPLLLCVIQCLHVSSNTSFKVGEEVPAWRRSRPARSAVEVSVFKYTYTDCRGPVGVEKGRGGHSLKRRVLLSASATPSRGECHCPCHHRLLMFFQAPYIKEGPLLLCKGLFWVVIFADTGEGVTEYIKGGYLQCNGRSGPNG